SHRSTSKTPSYTKSVSWQHHQVYYPGQDQDIKQRKAAVEGIEIVDDIYQYLISDALYNTSYETKNPFAQ
ncbi:TPA: hypothetical protein ACPY9M_004517, partial [Escherichia coli]